MKLVEENIVNSLYDIGIGKDFLNRNSFTQNLRPTIDKWDLLKLKSYCEHKSNLSVEKEPHRIEKYKGL